MRLKNLGLSDEQVHQLESLASRPKAAQRSVYRAKIILSRLAGVGVRATASAMNCKPATVRKWCRRVAAQGLDGLNDAQRSGRPRRISAVERCSVVAAACQAPAEYGLDGHTLWSGALLANALVHSGRIGRISARTVQRILKLASIKPHRIAYWKRKSDPAFDTKMRPIVGLYVNPPTDGPVVCADECTCIQALQRRFPDLPIRRPGELARREFEYKRHGTACLTAGLFVHTGQVLGMVTEKRPKAVFLAFLDLLDRRVPEGQVIHLIVDNLNTHRGAHIEAWLQAHPGRIVFYYLPFHASWLSQIELWFRTLKRRCLAGGDFTSVTALKAHIEAFIRTYNRLHAHPYTWTYTGDPLVA